MAGTEEKWESEIAMLARRCNGNYERFLKDKAYNTTIYDTELVHNVVALIKKNTVKDKIRALTLIQTHETKFPPGFDTNVLVALKKDKSLKVREEAKKIESEKNTKALLNYSKELSTFQTLESGYADIFKKISFDLDTTSTAFTQMYDVAKIVRDSLSIPICAIKPEDLNVFTKYQENLFKELPLLQFQLPNQSPILKTTEIVAPILDWNNQKLTIPQALGKSVSEVEYELDTVISSKTDVIFNFEGYPFLYNLERLIRELVQARICEKYRTKIDEKIPLDILMEWKRRRDIEKANPLVEGDYDLIEYSDFSHLKIIIEKRNNKKDFLDIFNDQELTGIITKLNELDPIRKKIAHSRSLTENEFLRLKMYAEDIARIMQKYSK